MKLLKDCDGSGRTPNQCQIDTFKYLEEVWNYSSVIGLNLSVGSGKSFVARAIQRSVPNTVILTPNNALVQQYIETYPELKRCIGVSHYKDSAECDANFAEVSLRKAPGIYNPASYWYRALRQRLGNPSVIICDEADAIYSMLKGFSDREFSISEKQSKMSLLSILLDRLSQAEVAWAKNPERSHLITRLNSAKYLYLELKNNEHLYSFRIYTTKGIRKRYTLKLSSLIVQESVQKRFFGNAKVILMSATLLPPDCELITGRDSEISFKSFSSPIPVASRRVYIGAHGGFVPNFQSDFGEYTQRVRTTIDELRVLGNGMVHTTYAEASVWGEAWQDALTHNKDNKQAVLNRFKNIGGVLLGSGMSAGIDLPGELCRFNIIPKLHYPNRSDPEVEKRQALSDGRRWYDLETLRHVMQAAGRSTRNPSDWSLVVVLDARLSNLCKRYWNLLPQWFTESLDVNSYTNGQLVRKVIRETQVEETIFDAI